MFEEDDCAALANDENDLGRENHKDMTDVALIVHSSVDCLPSLLPTNDMTLALAC